MPDESLGDEEKAFEVNVEDGVEVGFGRVPEVGTPFEAGIVDEDVDFAELSDGVGDELLALLDAAYVVLEGCAFSVELLDRGDDFVGSGFVGAVAKGDVGTLGGEFLCDGQAYSLAGSGDGCDFGLQAIRHGGCSFVCRRSVRYTGREIVA